MRTHQSPWDDLRAVSYLLTHMHRAIRTTECEHWCDESNKETQTFALVSTTIQELRPDFVISAFDRTADCEDGNDYDEQRDVHDKQRCLNKWQPLYQEGVKEQAEKDQRKDHECAMPTLGRVAGLAIDSEALHRRGG